MKKRIELLIEEEQYALYCKQSGKEKMSGTELIAFFQNQVEEKQNNYDSLKKTSAKLQNVIDDVAEIKNMLQQGTPKAATGGANVFAGGGSVCNNDILSNKQTVSQEMFTYSKDDMVIISKTKEGIPYINNNLKNLWNEFKIQVSGYESDKINIEQFEDGCEKRQLSIFIPTYRNNKDLFNYLLSK